MITIRRRNCIIVWVSLVVRSTLSWLWGPKSEALGIWTLRVGCRYPILILCTCVLIINSSAADPGPETSKREISPPPTRHLRNPHTLLQRGNGPFIRPLSSKLSRLLGEACPNCGRVSLSVAGLRLTAMITLVRVTIPATRRELHPER